MSTFKGLSGNALKLIAALSMLLDHAGLLLFPGNALLRILGRLAFPIFAFMIAQGCKYTRSRGRYFGQLFGLALACQTVYFLVDGSMYLSVLFTFSLAALMIFALQHCREKPTAFRYLLFAAAVAAVFILNQIFTIDYGFWGCMVPLFAALPLGTKYDENPVNVAALGFGLLMLALDSVPLQFWSLAAVPLLLLYSGKRGKRNMKYFFYIFYPAHLAVLQVLAWIVM